MLLRLISTPPLPTVLFTLGFPNLPENLPYPTNWIAQLQRLAADELEIPQVSHALDKSTWIISLLEEVTFDLTCLTVTCSFIDGTVEEWPLMQCDCTQLLESVLEDVNQSALESSKEKEPMVAAPVVSPTPPAPSKKHKKSRSLLMSFVATFVPSISLSSPVRETPPTVSSPTTPPVPSPTAAAEPSVSSRCLRRRARSNLVDAYRRFVATELSKRVRSGGYHSWITECLLRRYQSQMMILVEQAGGVVPELSYDYPLMSGGSGSPYNSHFSTRSSSLYPEDEGDGQSISTDGSSVHTPTDGHRLQFAYRSDVPRTPSPPNFSPEDFELYASLNRQGMRLRHLLCRITMYQRTVANEEKHLRSVLEIKSRRRAWSNGQYRGGAPMNLLGLATPFRSSPLAKYRPITADEWVQEPMDLTSSFQALSVSTVEHDTSELFPTSDDELDSPQDLELGLLEPVQEGLCRSPPVRMRRRSIRTANPLDPDNDFSPAPSPRISATSLLCQPLSPPEKEKREAIYDPDFKLPMDMPPAYFQRGDAHVISSYDQDWIRPGVVEYQ